MGDYRIVPSEAGLNLAIQATGYVYATGPRGAGGRFVCVLLVSVKLRRANRNLQGA